MGCNNQPIVECSNELFSVEQTLQIWVFPSPLKRGRLSCALRHYFFYFEALHTSPAFTKSSRKSTVQDKQNKTITRQKSTSPHLSEEMTSGCARGSLDWALVKLLHGKGR